MACFLTLLLVLPSHAQWSVVDQNGNSIPQSDDGSYPLLCNPGGHGTFTYPDDMDPYESYDVCPFDPGYYPEYFGGTPLWGLNGLSGGLGGAGWAQNNVYGNPYYFNGFEDELLQGTIQTSADAPLVARFHYTGDGTPPDYLNVLVKDNAYVRASVETPTVESDPAYGIPTIPDSLLSVHVAVSDGLGLSLSADASPSAPGPASVTPLTGGKPHLLRLPVVNGVAEVSIPAHFDVKQVNEVPYGSWNGPSGYGATSADFGASISAVVAQDPRTVTLHREGARNEVTTSDGVTHGDSRYSFLDIEANAEGNSQAKDNILVFHPEFSSYWSLNPQFVGGGTQPQFNVSWQWSTRPILAPDGFFHYRLPDDTWDTRTQIADYGTVRRVEEAWNGSADAAKTITVSYTATDLSPTNGATATATYKLTLHDEYENWRRVDRQGNLLGPNASPEDGARKLLGSTAGTLVPSGPVSIIVTSPGVNWSAAGINGGGVLSGVGSLVSVTSDCTWIGLLFSLAGLTIQTVASQPSDPAVPINSLDQMNLAFMQAAYQNTGYNITALPGEAITTNVMDAEFYNYIQKSVHTSQDWADVYNSYDGQVTVDTDVYMQMLDYNFYGDQYDNAGLVTTTAPALVSKPGRPIWYYHWHLGSTPSGPGLNPNSQPSAVNPMPAL